MWDPCTTLCCTLGAVFRNINLGTCGKHLTQTVESGAFSLPRALYRTYINQNALNFVSYSISGRFTSWWVTSVRFNTQSVIFVRYSALWAKCVQFNRMCVKRPRYIPKYIFFTNGAHSCRPAYSNPSALIFPQRSRPFIEFFPPSHDTHAQSDLCGRSQITRSATFFGEWQLRRHCDVWPKELGFFSASCRVYCASMRSVSWKA